MADVISNNLINNDVISEAATFTSIPNVIIAQQATLQQQQENTIEQSFQFASEPVQIVYDKNGLEYVSNLPYINKRDQNGNIIITGNVQNINDTSIFDTNIIFELNDEVYTTTSVNRVIDTQFRYFKFPPNIIVRGNVELPQFEVDEIDTDPIFARYRPSENRSILLNTSGILMDFLEDGILQKVPNLYYISPDVKNSGNDLRLRAKINHRYDGTGIGTAFFFITKEGPNYSRNRTYRGGFANTSNARPSLVGSINQFEVQDLFIDIIIENSEFEIGDTFGISALAGQEGHTITARQTYLVITDASKNVTIWNQPIESPTVPQQSGPIGDSGEANNSSQLITLSLEE